MTCLENRFSIYTYVFIKFVSKNFYADVPLTILNKTDTVFNNSFAERNY